MDLLASVRPDADAIYELINVWDHRCKTPGTCPHPPGAVTRFARYLRRHRQTFYNMAADGWRISTGLAMQIAGALHVDIDAITLPDTTETPQPQAAAEAA